MSLCIDKKIIRPVNCSGSHCISFIIFWISASICNVVNPGKFFHPPSIRSNSRRWRDSHAHNTESEKTQVFAVANWTALSVSKGVICHLSLLVNHSILFPCVHGPRVWIHLAQTQYWIGEYIDFCLWQLDCFVSQQSCPLPRILCANQTLVYLNFCLICDQLFCHVKQFSYLVVSTAASNVADMNIHHTNEFASRSFMSSPDFRPIFCSKFE